MVTGTESTSTLTTINTGMTGQASTNARAEQNANIENKGNQYKQLTGFGIKLDIYV